MKLFNAKIFVCPLCIRVRRFRTLKNLNIHLSISHRTKFKLTIVAEAAPPKLRLKKPKLKKYVFN